MSHSCCARRPRALLCRWKGPWYIVLVLVSTEEAVIEVVIVGDGPKIMREYFMKL